MKVIITNLPAFYKIRLYNEVNKKVPLHVVFTNKGAEGRNNDFYSGQIGFDYTILKKGGLQRIRVLRNLLKTSGCSEVILGGWESTEQFFCAFFSPLKKNSLIVESTINESSTNGIKALIKRLFLKRISKVYAAGELHSMLIRSLGFKKEIVISGGCGLLNYVAQPPFEARQEVKKFLFVGRLIDVKNLPLLISVFNSLPDLTLTIIGFGEEEENLKSVAKDNIQFLGSIPNVQLPSYYREADVFVLPSKSETWGLVVEEALNNGLPVIVSDRVGCQKDLITKETGIVFEYSDGESLRAAILKMTDVTYYNNLRKGVANLDFNKRAQRQIDCFIN